MQFVDIFTENYEIFRRDGDGHSSHSPLTYNEKVLEKGVRQERGVDSP